MSHTHTIQENLKRISLTILTQELVQLQADTSTTSFLKCESAFVCLNFFFSTAAPRVVYLWRTLHSASQHSRQHSFFRAYMQGRY